MERSSGGPRSLRVRALSQSKDHNELWERPNLKPSSDLFRSCIPQYNNGRFSAGCAEFLMAMKRFVGITMPFTQNFYLFHFTIVFFCDGKKLKQPGFKQLVRVGRPCK